MWNEELANLKARMWKNCGRPKRGIICQENSLSKLEYKRAIKDANKCLDNRNKQKVALSVKNVEIVNNYDINGNRLLKK